MQQEFYIGQKVRTSQLGIDKRCTDMQGYIAADRIGQPFPDCFDVEYTLPNGSTIFGIFAAEEIEPDVPMTPELVFDNIVKSL